jgi:hypothetical protein
VRFRLSGVGQARYGVVGQVRLVTNRRVAVDTGEAFWGMERRGRSGTARPGQAFYGQVRNWLGRAR